MLCDFLVTQQVIPSNPSARVKAPRLSRTTRATPVLTSGEAAKLLCAIGTTEPRDLRDRAMIATMLYTFGRIGAVLQLGRQEYAPNYGPMVLTLLEAAREMIGVLRGQKKREAELLENLPPFPKNWRTSEFEAPA
jgi:site-specific recombinase XerC